MPKRKYEKPLYLDMPFGEALGRYIGTDPKELEAVIAKTKRKKKKPPGAGTPGGSQDDQNVIRLRDKRKSKQD